MAIAEGESRVFHELAAALYNAQIEKNDPLLRARSRAWDQFLELGLPTKRSEPFQYVKLKKLFSASYVPAEPTEVPQAVVDAHTLPECHGAVLVFINGHFSPKLSSTGRLPQRMAVLTLEQAARTYGAFLSNRWARALKEETDPFAALNTAAHSSGAFIYVPPKTVPEAPLQVLHLIDAADKPMFILPHCQLFLGMEAELKVVFTQHVLSGEAFFVNALSECVVDENAHLVCVQDGCDVGADGWIFDAFRAHLKRNSTLRTTQMNEGGATVRYDYRVTLGGEGGEALLNGVWMLKKNREAHTHVVVDHQAPHCHSYQLFKGALADASRSSFEGKILIRSAAQQTDAYQLNHNLLLSDKAKADSKPNLEIFADDVKASHGSTVGQLNAQQLLYLQTRGIPETKAQALMVVGFCSEVVDKVTVPSVHKRLIKRAHRYMEG